MDITYLHTRLKSCSQSNFMEPQSESEVKSDMKEEQIKDPALKGVVGIQNMGNTCYSNSTIQLIRACPEWNAYCLTQNFTDILKNKSDDNNYKRIIIAYQEILKSLWSSYRPAYVRPLGFISEVRKAVKGTVYEMFGVPIPNDSHEYLVYLLDCFHEALKTTYTFQAHTIDTSLSNNKKMEIMAENGWNKYLSMNTSEIVNLFFGMFRKSIYCTNCKNTSYQWEVFNSLKIPCDGNTFIEWIQNEVKETEIEGYHCDNCKIKTPDNYKHNAKIYTHIWRLPANLFVTLRRFNFDGRKNMKKCPYNGENIVFEQFFADESNHPSRTWSYEIRGVSDHHGSHMGGHYTSQFKHPISGEWWGFDDESSTKMESPYFSESNYIFYFRKIN